MSRTTRSLKQLLMIGMSCHAGQELSSWQAKNKTHFLQESYQQTKLGEMLLMLFYPTPSTQETRII